MTTTLTPNAGATLQQIAELTATGCDIIHVARPSEDDAEALPGICRHSGIPVATGIHFRSRYVFQAVGAGCGVAHVDPGNVRVFDDQAKEIARTASDHDTALCIGVNAGSLDKRLYEKYGGATPEVPMGSTVWEVSLFENVGFHNLIVSMKHHDPLTMVQACHLLSQAREWPLHPGVTEASPQFQGTIKSAMAFGILLSGGIGDAIRVPLNTSPVEEVKVGLEILHCLGLYERNFEIVSCPSCGRSQMDTCIPVNEVSEGLRDTTCPLWVAVMGCIVNGPGEAREADLGVASGNGKGKIFIKGRIVKTVPESEIVTALIVEASRLGRKLGLDSGSPMIEIFESVEAGSCP